MILRSCLYKVTLKNKKTQITIEGKEHSETTKPLINVPNQEN